MTVLSDEMQRLVEAQRLGFVATVCEDGSPNLSPKGTFVVVDASHLAFGELRSPNTLRNLRRDPRVEVNCVDPFTRKGYRFKGRAVVLAPGSAEFAALHPAFVAVWGALAARLNAIVRIEVTEARPLTSPAYDLGATEAELRQSWTRKFRDLQPNGVFVE